MLKPLKWKDWEQTFLRQQEMNQTVIEFEVNIISREKETLWWVETDLTAGFLVNSSHLWVMKLYSDSRKLTRLSWLLSHSAPSMALYQQLWWESESVFASWCIGPVPNKREESERRKVSLEGNISHYFSSEWWPFRWGVLSIQRYDGCQLFSMKGKDETVLQSFPC